MTSPDRINVLSLPAPANRVFGFDRPLGFLSDDGYVYTFAGYKSSQKWDDLVVTGLGALYALRGEVLSVRADSRGKGAGHVRIA